MYESYVTFEIPKQTYDVVISFKVLPRWNSHSTNSENEWQIGYNKINLIMSAVLGTLSFEDI